MRLAPVITISRSVVAARSLRYPLKEKQGSTEPRVMYADGINCRPETAVIEFAEVRAKYGKQGAVRKAPATYELPAEGEEPTHVRRTYPSGRKYWALAEENEQATHVRREGVAYEPAGRAVATHKRVGRRWVETSDGATHVAVEGGYARETEAINLIYAFDLSSVNPNDPKDTEQGFEFVRADIEHKFLATDGGCAVQAQLVGQADGKGTQFHVHVTVNPILVKDCVTPDGEIIPAGRKLTAQLTDIDWIRDSSNDLAVERPGLGFDPQPKDAAARAADKRSSMDRRMEAQGQKSNHDVIRDAYETTMEDPRVMDLDVFRAVMLDDHEVTVTLRGKKKPTLSYKLPSMPQAVRGGDRTKQLGSHYSYESTMAQLAAKVAGLPRGGQPVRVPQLPPRPDPVITEQQFHDGMHTIDLLVTQEHRDRVQDWAKDRATERGQSVDEILARLPQSAEAQYRAVQVWQAIKTASEEREAQLDAWIQDWAAAEGLDTAELLALHGYTLDNPADRATLRSVMVTEQQEAATAAQQIQVEPEIAGVEVPETPTAVTPPPVVPKTPVVRETPPAPRAETAAEMMARVWDDLPELRSSAEDHLAEIEARIAEIPTSPAKVEAEREEVTAEEIHEQVTTAEIQQVSATEELEQAEEAAAETETEAVLREDAPEPADLRGVEAAEVRARQLAEQRKAERLQGLNMRVEQLDQQPGDSDKQQGD